MGWFIAILPGSVFVYLLLSYRECSGVAILQFLLLITFFSIFRMCIAEIIDDYWYCITFCLSTYLAPFSVV